MREQTFVTARQAGWLRLETLLGIVDRRGLRGLDARQIGELALLYRATTTDLATAQSRGYGAAIEAYLNRLVARAHAFVYAGSAGLGWTRLGRFFATTFPREVRRSWRPIALCVVLFTFAVTVAYVSVSARPSTVYALLPDSEIPLVRKSLHDANFSFDGAFAPAMSSAIIVNNVQVAAMAVAGGMTLGVLTLWAILNNGLTLGGLGALFATRGFGLDFWATVAPHGVIELTAIQIAGGSGLLLAAAIAAPGRLRRIDALKRNGRRAATLLGGVVALLVVAGTIEGFFSPLDTPDAARFGVGALTGSLLIAYLGLAGRPRRPLGADAGVPTRASLP